MDKPLFKGKYRVESARLRGWDYASAAWYFVTICTHRSECLFGNVVEGKMQPSPMGEVARQSWAEIPQHFTNASLDAFVLMPNHVHGIIVLEPADTPTPDRETVKSSGTDVAAPSHDRCSTDRCRDVACNVSTTSSERMSRVSPKAGSLSAIVRSYKAAVTRRCRLEGLSSFRWQARFYDHIIRSEESLRKIREYVANNALQWELDKYYRSG